MGLAAGNPGRCPQRERLAHRVRCFAFAAAHIAAVEPAYSISTTGRPVFVHESYTEHSWNAKHCSLTAKSKPARSVAACSRSFFRPTARPRACTTLASIRLKASCSAPVSGKPVSFGVAVDVVEVDRVEAGLHALVDACRTMSGCSTVIARMSSHRSPGHPFDLPRIFAG